jgi:hypothetical protein
VNPAAALSARPVPADIRGEFQPVASSVPGLRLSEHVPRLAQGAHRLALLRAVAHPDNTHTVAMPRTP